MRQDVAAAAGAAVQPRGLQTFAALKYPNFRLLWVGMLISNSGNAMQWVAQMWLALELTNSPLFLGIVGAARGIPQLLFALIGGVLADRLERRRLLLVTQGLAMVVQFTLAALILLDAVNVAVFLLLVLLSGTLMAFDMPARQSLVPQLIEDRKDLLNALALMQATMQVTMIASPAISGLLIGRFGLHVVYSVMALSHLGIMGALVLMRVPPLPPRMERRSVLGDLAQGFRYALGQPLLRALLLITLLPQFFGMSFTTLVPVFAREIGVGAPGMGVMQGSFASGGIIGGLLLASLGSRFQHKGWLALGASVFFGCFLMAMGFAPWFLVSAALQGGLGLMSTLRQTSLSTLLFTHSDSQFHGRLMSIRSLEMGMMPLSSVMVGALGQTIGVMPTWFLMGAAGTFLSLTLFMVFPAVRRLP